MKVGSNAVFPASLRKFNRNSCDGLIFDDVRDLDFVVSNQEVFQGKYSEALEFSSTQGGTCAFSLYLFKVPIVVTINFSTKNRAFLQDNDFLMKSSNRVVVSWPPPGFRGF